MNHSKLILLFLLACLASPCRAEWLSSKPNLGMQGIGIALALGGVYTIVKESPKESSSLGKLCKGGALIGFGALIATGNTKNAYQTCAKKTHDFCKQNHLDEALRNLIIHIHCKIDRFRD